MTCTRRTFLTAASGIGPCTALAASTVQGANNRIRIGVIGTGGRARGLMNQLKTAAWRGAGGRLRRVRAPPAPGRRDRRRRRRRRSPTTAGILDNREIDAVLIGTPDHWHKTMTLDAVAAGKDVYVEKPVSHTIEEGVEMVRAIEASKQVVQTGTQQRSWEHWMLGKQIIDSGRLGQITFVQTYWYQHASAGNFAPVDAGRSSTGSVAGPGARSAVPAGTLLPVAPLLGLRRRLPDRPA